MKNTTLLIMAAGIGSRFGGGIKQLEPVGLHNEIIEFLTGTMKKRGVNKKDVEKRLKSVFMDSLVGVADCQLVW